VIAHIEWKACGNCAIARTGEGFAKYGDRWEFACFIERHGDTAKITGANGSMPMAAYRAVRVALKAELFAWAEWERIDEFGNIKFVRARV